jgi:hypothetical protein
MSITGVLVKSNIKFIYYHALGGEEMANQMNEEKIYEEARRRVKAKRDFLSNLGSWAVVNVVLIIVWALTDSGGYLWFLWPLCIWGFFILVHYLRVFVFQQKSEIGAVEKEADKIRREQR